MDKDIARLVERLEAGQMVVPPHEFDHVWRPNNPDGKEAASTIRALVAEIERLRDKRDEMSVEAARLFELHRQAEAKLREAVELMRALAGAADDVGVEFYDYEDPPKIVEAMNTATRAARAFLATMEKTDDENR